MRNWVNGLGMSAVFVVCSMAIAQPEMPEPPAPVVERTVTIRLLDPDGEPVADWPMSISTSYHAWRNSVWMSTIDDEERHPADESRWPSGPFVTDEDGYIRARVEFFEGDWEFSTGLWPITKKSERDQYPASTVDRITERSREMNFAPTYSFQTSGDPALMTFEIRAERVVQVRVTLVDHRNAGSRQLRGRLWPVKRGPRQRALNIDDVPQDEGLGAALRHPAPDHGEHADQADDQVGDGRVEQLNAIPGLDHVLMIGSRCWLITSEQIAQGADLGRFDYAPPAATGILNLRLAPAFLDQATGRASTNRQATWGRKFGAFRPTLLSTDGAYFQSFRVDEAFDFRTRNEAMGFTETGEGMTYVPPGEYFILDFLPFDAASHGMRFALVTELLRGHFPEKDELPTITVVEGVNPFVEIEMADCYNALKAWYDKRFPRADVPGFD